MATVGVKGLSCVVYIRIQILPRLFYFRFL